jgi:hypothetical protein
MFTVLTLVSALLLSGPSLQQLPRDYYPFSEIKDNILVKEFEENISSLTQSQRWVGGTTVYDSNKKPKSYGKYSYDSGTVRRVWYSKGSKKGFVLISDGKVSCERPTSAKFSDSLEADLKAEWLCIKTGNPELVRFIFSLRPSGVMQVLDTASMGSTGFKIKVTSSINNRKITINSLKAQNVKASKIVFSKNKNILNVSFSQGKKLQSESFISPAGDSNFVTRIEDLNKKWKE